MPNVRRDCRFQSTEWCGQYCRVFERINAERWSHSNGLFSNENVQLHLVSEWVVVVVAQHCCDYIRHCCHTIFAPTLSFKWKWIESYCILFFCEREILCAIRIDSETFRSALAVIPFNFFRVLWISCDGATLRSVPSDALRLFESGITFSGGVLGNAASLPAPALRQILSVVWDSRSQKSYWKRTTNGTLSRQCEK